MKIINWFKENYILIIVLFVASFLRFYHTDFQSIWCDEILSMINSNPKQTLKELYDSVLFWEFLPHLYFYLLRFVFEIFGYTTLVARLFSGVIGVFGVYSIYLLGKEIFNKRVGLISALFLSVNYFHINYSQEIRPYGMLFLFTVLSFYRLIVFLKSTTLNNAIYYGFFTGLIIHSHFFGFISIFAQCIIILFFIIIAPLEKRKKLFQFSLISGIVTLIVIAPGYAAIKRMTEIKTFWLAPPTADVYSKMISEIFGNSEMVLYSVNLIIIAFFISVFIEKQEINNNKSLFSSKLIFSSIILFIWMIVSLIIPLLKSHIDVSMIIDRYFISIVAILIIVLAISTELIKSNIIKTIVIIYVTIFSIVDLFIVKKYYSTVKKAQFRELTNQIREKNIDKSKIVTMWSWLFPHFYQNEPEIKIDGGDLEAYITLLKNGKTKQNAFWYADANSRPYNISIEAQSYLDKNFKLKEKIDLYDAWANYYVPIKEVTIEPGDKLKLSSFSPVNFDDNGNILLFNSCNAKSSFFQISKGNYNLIINGNSLPAIPINNENAHLKIKLNGLLIGEYFLNEDSLKAEKKLPFVINENKNVRFQIIYDNDISVNEKDRNVIIYSIKIEKN